MFKFRVYTVLFLFVLFLGGVKFANAQGGDVYFGVGTATDTVRTGTNSVLTDLSGGNLAYFTGACEPGPTMGGAFGSFGADYMFRPTLACRLLSIPFDSLKAVMPD